MMDNNQVFILADPCRNAWDFAENIHKKLSQFPKRKDNILRTIYEQYLNKKQKDYLLGKIKITYFNDSEIFPTISESIREKKCYLIHDSSMNPQDWLVSLAFLKDNFIRAYAGEINFVLPYMRYTRQDRITEERSPISFGVVAEILKGVRVITTDLHNPSTAIAFKPIENLRAYPVIIRQIQENHKEFLENCIIVPPDAGAMQIANSYSKRLNLGIISGYKKRDRPGVVGKLDILGDVKNKNVLITDDMIDTAGSLCKCAEVLKEKGAKHIYACSTHGVFSMDEKGVKARKRIEESPLEKVIVTDSIPQKSEGKIEVISLTDLFAEAIYRMSHGISISELYKK